MPETSNISATSGIKAVDGKYQRQGKDTRQDKNKKRNPSKLHLGEIVRGVIVEVISKILTRVRIPTGTFQAQVTGVFKKGDTLLFKVIQTSPTLTLQVYAVIKSSNKKISDHELIRALDLPDEPLYQEIVSNYSGAKVILRQNIIDIYNVYEALGTKATKSIEAGSLLKMLIELKDAEIPLNITLINKLLPVVETQNKFLSSLIKLKELLAHIPTGLANNVNHYYNIVASNKFEPLLLIEKSGNRKSFIDLLREVMLLGKTSNELELAKNHAQSLIKTLDAIRLWNAIARYSPLQFKLLTICNIDNDLTLLWVFIRSNGSDEKAKKSHKFSFNIDTTNLGVIRCEFIVSDEKIDLLVGTVNKSVAEVLEKNAEDLYRQLKRNDFSVESMSVKDGDFSGLDFIADEHHSSQHNFTVVI